MGSVAGEYLACGYHGLKFDVNGNASRCRARPKCRPAPGCAAIRCTRRTTSSGSGWATPARPTPRRFPICRGCPIRNGRRRRAGSTSRSNYQFIIDNLLDLTHVAHVHKKTIAGDPREATTPTKTERLNDGVRVGRWMIDFVPPPLFAKAGNFTENVDRWQYVTWHPPGIVYLDVGCAKAGTGAPQGDRSQGISIWSTPSDHAGDRALQPLHVRLLARFQNRRPGDVEAAVTRARVRPSSKTWNFSKRCRTTGWTARSTA